MAKRSFYAIGYTHGVKGIRAMSHRKRGRYDSQSANEAYYHGYAAGSKARDKLKEAKT